MYFSFLRFVLLVLFMIDFRHLVAQESDMQLYDLFSKQDYFTLNEQYPLLKKQASKQYLLLTEAYLNHFFNKPEQSNENIRQLFTEYSDWLPAENQVSLALMMANNASNMQDYATSASINAQLIEQLETQLDSFSLEMYKHKHKLCVSLESVLPIEVIYGKKQTKIQLDKDTFGLLTLPVFAGKEKTDTLNFTLDFGAGFSMIEEKYARIFNIRTLSDSILIGNPYGSYDYVKIGVAEEIYIGDILVKNVIFLIAPNRIVDLYPENEMNAILGMSVLQALGNLQIGRSHLLISSSKQRKRSSNMLISQSSLFVQAKTSNLSLCLHFDSGSNNSHLNKNYLSKSQKEASSFLTDSILMGYFGGMQKIEILKYPDFSCKIGNKTLHFPSMYIEMADYLSGNISIDGVLGLDMILQHKKIIIDFKNMYFRTK